MKNKIIIFICLVIIFIFVAFNCYFYFFSDNDKCLGDKCNNSNKIVVSENEFNLLITDELYILLRKDDSGKKYSSLSDVTNYDIHTLIFNRFEDSNEITTDFSKADVEEAYNNAICFTRLNNLKHENFDNYYFMSSENTYVKEKNITSSRNNLYAKIGALKIFNYIKDGDKYKMDVNFLLYNNSNNYDNGANLYGSVDDLSDVSKSIVSISKNMDYQKYLDDNYAKIKKKLDTYHFEFVVLKNGRTFLVNFSIN